jgi:catalase (peroxidase I)
MPTTAQSFVFDKQYYEELVRRPWRARNLGTKDEDFTASTDTSHEEPQFMLKTDMCLWFDTDYFYPCCTRTRQYDGNGDNWCDFEQVLSDKQCTRYEYENSRMEAVETVVEFLGGPPTNQNNDPFYKAFSTAWFKATTNGHGTLKAVRSECW